MACLSVVENPRPGEKARPAYVIANPIYVTSPIQELRPGTELIFEIFEKDAETLRPLVDKVRWYVLDSEISSFGKLKSLNPCESTHTGLAYLRHKPTLRGVLVFFGEEAISRQ